MAPDALSRPKHGFESRWGRDPFPTFVRPLQQQPKVTVEATPEAVESFIQLSERDDVAERQRVIEAELKDVAGRVNHVVAAIQTGGPIETLVSTLKDLEAKQATLRDDLVGLRPTPRPPLRVVENRLAQWRRLLRSSTTQARAVIQRLIPGRITFTPRADQEGYDFAAETRYDRLFAGVSVKRPSFIKPGDTRGTDHILAGDNFENPITTSIARFLQRIPQ